MNTEIKNIQQESLWQKIKPSTNREWIKLFFDIAIMLFLLFVVYYATSSYSEGYQTGLSVCMQKGINSNISWVTNISQNITIIYP